MRAACLGLAWLMGCSSAPAPQPPPRAPTPVVSTPSTARKLIVIGTNDLHGHLSALPVFGGYLANLRAEAAQTGAVVLLVDAGDMFQGTLESNVVEGESIAKAYDMLGYSAAAVGNHEFDFGPLGPAATLAPDARGGQAYAQIDPGKDPRGALRARARGVSFPFLLANAMQAGQPPGALADLAPIRDRALVTLGGVRIGITGVTSGDTPRTTMAANVHDLEFSPPEVALRHQAEALRREGATVVVGLAHAGSKCEAFTGSVIDDRCHRQGEVFAVAEQLPVGSFDAIVAGHTHFGVAHVVNEIPVIESYSYGRAFGRVDLDLDAHGRVVGRTVHAPQYLCPSTKAPADESCVPGDYAGKPVVRDARLVALVGAYASQTRARREAPVGVSFMAPVLRSYGAESALGNLFASLVREHTQADVALMNGGGLRDDLPVGALRYGQLFSAMPFDNRIATVTLTAAALRSLFAANLQSTHGILSVDGLSVQARCVKGQIAVDLFRTDATGKRRGKALGDKVSLRVAASDFLLGGGDDFGSASRLVMPPGSVRVTDDVMRDVFERRLAGQGTVDPARWYQPARPRLIYPGPRPMKCAVP